RGGAGGGLGASWADGVALQCGGAGRRGIQAFVPLGGPAPARGPGKGAGERLQRSAREFLRKPPPFGGGSADAGRLLAGKRRLKPLLPPRLSLHLPDEFHDIRRQSDPPPDRPALPRPRRNIRRRRRGESREGPRPPAPDRR